MRACAIPMLMLGLCACAPVVNVPGVWCQFASDCGHPNVCHYNRCRPRCATGSDCPSGLCLASYCGVVEDRGCTTPGTVCGDQLVCGEDRCTLPCVTACASGATCRPASGASFSICVAPGDAPPDADTSDGGTGDGGTGDVGTRDGA